MLGTSLLRRTVLRLLERFNPGSIKVRHHWTGDSVRLDMFVHRTYWYHGKRREEHLMRWFAAVLKPGDVVVELGGHIGYLTLYYASLVGEKGRVIVFEPGPNNLPFIKDNTAGKRNVEIRERAVGDKPGTLPMYIETLSGMNNSMVADFEQLETNAKYSGVAPTIKKVDVPVVRLDDEFAAGSRIDFVKVDIEGFEFEALSGMENILATIRPLLLVELNRRHDDTVALLRKHGYAGYSETGELLPQKVVGAMLNTFWLHPAVHAEAIKRTKAFAH